jgi:hypothetical protein
MQIYRRYLYVLTLPNSYPYSDTKVTSTWFRRNKRAINIDSTGYNALVGTVSWLEMEHFSLTRIACKTIFCTPDDNVLNTQLEFRQDHGTTMQIECVVRVHHTVNAMWSNHILQGSKTEWLFVWLVTCIVS